jgi:hypothetical protein
LYAYCGNDPINRHDPLGLADWNTVAQAEHVELLLALAKLSGDIGDGIQATQAEAVFLRALNRDPEAWARSIYLNRGSAGLANYVGERDRILSGAFEIGAPLVKRRNRDW